MKLVYVLVAAAFLTLASSTQLMAQSPDGQFGVGVVAGSTYGGYLAYAITPAIHVGSGIGLRVESNNNQFYIGPYGKFLFAGSKELKPFIIGQFMFMTSPVEGGDASSSLGFGGGAEYFITPNFGLAGSLTILSLGFTPSITTFGLMNGNIMAEWFFN